MIDAEALSVAIVTEANMTPKIVMDKVITIIRSMDKDMHQQWCIKLIVEHDENSEHNHSLLPLVLLTIGEISSIYECL